MFSKFEQIHRELWLYPLLPEQNTQRKNCFWQIFLRVIYEDWHWVHFSFLLLTLKRLGGQFDPHPHPSPCSFSRNVSSKETFNIIITHIFPESLIEISEFVQRIWRHSLSILAIFIDSHRFFGFFWHFFVTKKLITSAYNRWCQHFFTFNIL